MIFDLKFEKYITLKILIAPDSFKNSLSAFDVADSIQKGILSINKDADCKICAMADGGEGTVVAMMSSTEGQIIKVPAKDPLNRPIQAFYGIIGDKTTAIIEMAAASGIELLTEQERNPWATSTYGTGMLIKDALNKGVSKIILGIGGSATNDCGAGMAQALGVRFLNPKGFEINPSGGTIGEIETIDISNIDPRIAKTEIVAACDVTNPLYGENGAAFVYAPQKGADLEMVKRLDANLCHFAEIIKKQLNKDIATIPGAGAAGGLGAGIIAFMEGALQQGFPLISEAVGLEQMIAYNDLIVTGEGKIDGQTQFGKVPFSIAQLAKKYDKPVIAIGGTIAEDSNILLQKGIDAIIPITDKPCSLDYALENASILLENTGKRIASLLMLGSQLK